MLTWWSVLILVVVIIAIEGWWNRRTDPFRTRPVRKPAPGFAPHTSVDILKHLPPKTGDRYCVIGVGFLGKTIVGHLLLRGETNITTFDVTDCPKEWVGDSRIKHIKGSMTNKDQITQALKGIDAVFMTAALIKYYERLTHQYKTSHAVNVEGTNNVIDACLQNGVKRFVYTSTSNVALDPKRMHKMQVVDEDTPLPTENWINHYQSTKILGEKAVLAANNKNGVLKTVAIRPCSGIFGDGDRLITTQKLITKSSVAIFNDVVIDWVYVENVSLGEILADQKLKENTDAVAGHAFCISNEEPLSAFEFNSALQYFYPELKMVTMSTWIAYLLGHFSELMQRLFKGKVSLGDLDLLTPASITVMKASYVAQSDKARRLLGYRPAYTVDQGIHKLVDLHVQRTKSKSN